MELHREALVVDTHCDTLKCLIPMFTLPRDSQWDDRSDIGMGTRSSLGHIDHIVGLVGPDHVGLGSDFDGVPYTPEGLEDVTKMPNITAELVMRGYSEEDVKKILGLNHLRLMKEVVG